MISFSDIQDAFLFVSSAPYGEHSAVLCKDTGRILYRSEMSGVDEIGEDELDWDKCVGIPHKNDLDLGQELVFEFVEKHLQNDYHRVQEIFRGRGAYGRFKNFLDSKGMLERWYAFENEREEEALRQWCAENRIALSDQ